jgi:predicted nucleotidyltransferase component of viral defense system
MLDKQKHEIILRNILKDIYSDSSMASLLGFKGGTACYLFYNLDRFSLDLDFNLLNAAKKEEVFNKIQLILKKYGTFLEDSIKRNTIVFVLSYNTKAPNIKIEISLRNFKDNYDIKSMLGISIQVMTESNMFAHKLVALTDRKIIANRDLYDIYWFFKRDTDISEDIILKRTGINLKEYLVSVERFISEKANNKHILNGLGEILIEKQKDWVRNCLKEELLFTIRNYIAVLSK